MSRIRELSFDEETLRLASVRERTLRDEVLFLMMRSGKVSWWY